MTKKGAQVRSDALVSRREYARRRGVTENAIRKVIASGILKPALRGDLIDVAAADVMMAAHKIGGAQVSTGLLRQRTRKLAAGCALLQDEIAELENNALPTAGVAAVTRDIVLQVARTLWPIAGMAPRLAGQTPPDAQAVLDDEVRRRLDAIANTKVIWPKSMDRKGRDGRALADMSAVDLAELRASLQAQRLETQRGLRRGELVNLTDATKVAVDQVLRMKTKLLGIPAKVAANFVGVVDAAELEPLLQQEVAEALAELAGPSVTVAEIEAARHQAPEPEPGRRLTFRLSPHEGRTGT